MYSIHLFYCFMVISGRLASSQNGCDLKLDQIFRTPKDFSKVNFDHFEIIERNNFETTPTPSTTPQNDIVPTTMDHPPKSVANAQIMLRFGGDNMHNCRGITISPSSRSKLIERSYKLDDVHPIRPRPLAVTSAPPIYPYNEYGYPVFPRYVASSQMAPQCSYSYPQPPYNFPGYYYGVRPLPAYISNPYGVYNGPFLPAGEIIGPNEALMLKENTLEGTRNTFLDYSKPLIITAFTGNQNRLQENLNEEKPLRASIPNIRNVANVYDRILRKQGQLVEETVVETTADTPPIIAIAKPEMYLMNSRHPIVQDTMVETIADRPILAISEPEVYSTNQRRPVVGETVVETTVETPIIAISRPGVVKITNIDTSSNLRSYVEANTLREAELTCLPKEDILTLLNQALVSLNCQKCQQRRKLLVTYPITYNRDVAIDSEMIEVPQCPCCTQCGICGCCNRERNSSIPYGQRFSKDLDSLLEIVPGNSRPVVYKPSLYPTPSCTEPSKYEEVQTPIPYQQVIPLPPSYILNQVVNVPTVPPTELFTPSVTNQAVPLVYGGYKRTSSYISTASPNCEKSGPHVDGIQTSSGSGYYSDPIKSIVYKEPTVTNILRVENPVKEEAEVVEPQLYQVIPKNDIVNKGGIKSLNIPELVPTNKYICANCNKVIPRIVCHREFVPVEESIPDAKNANSAPLIKGMPLVSNDGSERYCPTCSEYMGELNEVSNKR